MKLVIISDTHLQFKDELPEGDILIHCGDALNGGSIKELAQFITYLETQKHKYKHILFTPGNHDRVFEWNPTLAIMEIESRVNNLTVLHEKEITIDAIKFYGTSFHPEFGSWSFGLPRGEKLEEVYNRIPNDVNVLITHSPPLGILDKTPDNRLVGSGELSRKINNDLNQLKLHTFGHIHHSSGQIELNDVKYINAAICGESYKAINKPVVVDI